jgi:elongation factor Ts
VRREEVPAELVQQELDLAKKQLREQKKPEAMLEKIATGKLDKWFSDICLMEQVFVKDDKKKVGEIVTAAVAKIGENIQVRRFTRFALGEGLEKKVENYAEEVAKAAGVAT